MYIYIMCIIKSIICIITEIIHIISIIQIIHRIIIIAYRFLLFLQVCLLCLVFSIIHDLDTKNQNSNAASSLSSRLCMYSSTSALLLFQVLSLTFKMALWMAVRYVVCELLGIGMVQWYAMKADDTFEPSFEMTILIRRIIWDIWIIQMIQIISVIILIMLLIIRIILFCDHMDYISGQKNHIYNQFDPKKYNLHNPKCNYTDYSSDYRDYIFWGLFWLYFFWILSSALYGLCDYTDFMDLYV